MKKEEALAKLQAEEILKSADSAAQAAHVVYGITSKQFNDTPE